MAVHYQNTEKHTNYFEDRHECFMCGENVWDDSDVIVYWMGINNSIFLHPDCAITLGTKIIRDGVQANMRQPQHTGERL